MSDFAHVAIFNRLMPYRSSDAHASLITREGMRAHRAQRIHTVPQPLGTQAASSGAAPFLAVAVAGAESFTRARRTSVIAGYAVTET